MKVWYGVVLYGMARQRFIKRCSGAGDQTKRGRCLKRTRLVVSAQTQPDRERHIARETSPSITATHAATFFAGIQCAAPPT